MSLILALQTANDLREIVSTNDATIVGVLIAVVVALTGAVIYLYKNVQTLNKAFIFELKAHTEVLLKVNQQQNEFVKNIMELKNK